MNPYTRLIRPLFFQLDAETAHHLAIKQLAAFGHFPALLRPLFGHAPEKPTTLWGLTFRNPVGLAAGLDKNAVALPAWEALGFGFAEVGTITAKAQPGNPPPRLFRYPGKGALINRMGFNNDGAEAVATRLERLKESGRWPHIPVGINLGKSKVTELADAPADYLASFRRLHAFGDYFVVNVSSPNTPGLRKLQEGDSLRAILRTLRAGEPNRKPLLVKIAPDLEPPQLEELAGIAQSEGVDGLIATNTTLDHSAIEPDRDETGGLSGAPLRCKSTAMLARLRQLWDRPIIASGGVMDAEAGLEKFATGAELAQIYTGFIYRGPALIREICDAL